MGKRLNRDFYSRPALEMAKNLLGKYIVIEIVCPSGSRGNKKLVGKIVETEAYVGPQDKAAHSYGGKVTSRNKILYSAGGYIYIYLVYGMYWQFNITAASEGEPECVLIRAIDQEGSDISLTNGPGKLCRCLKLDRSFYGEDLVKSKMIWLEDRGEEIKPCQILAGKRIGIDYAGPYWSGRKWRFLIKSYQKYLPKHGKRKK